MDNHVVVSASGREAYCSIWEGAMVTANLGEMLALKFAAGVIFILPSPSSWLHGTGSFRRLLLCSFWFTHLGN